MKNTNFNEKYQGYLVHIIPTLACNLRCQYCYTNSIKLTENKLDVTYYSERVAQFINALEVSAIHIEGGEPLLYKGLIELIEKISNKEKIVIVTNGYFVNDEILRLLSERGVKRYILSLDYPFAIMDNKMKSGVEALNCFNRNGIIPSINVTLSKDNLRYLNDMLQLAQNKGIKKIRFGDIIPIGAANNYKDRILDANDYEMLIKNFYDIISNYPSLDTGLSLHGNTFFKCSIAFREEYQKIARMRFCDQHNTKITISPDGGIYTCFNLIDDKQYYLGNVLESFSVQDLNSAHIKKRLNCPIGIHCHISFKSVFNN